MKPIFSVLSREQVVSLLGCYDVPHPARPGKLLPGYDKSHALRTARMCVAVAAFLGYPPARLQQFESACLLHDIGRTGLQPAVFGKIWSWAKENKIPTRPREWRTRFPETPYGKESQAFIRLYRKRLENQGIILTPAVKDHIDMRLGFAKRLRQQLKHVQPRLAGLGISWKPWMERIMLYYYYPEKLDGAAIWIHRLAEILVGCEQLEAYSNHRRGRDYYGRSQESVSAAFAFLKKLTQEDILSVPVFEGICRLTREGHFLSLLRQARGGRLTASERRFLQTLAL